MLVVKGTLRHRIELIGMEQPKEELTDAQRKLREAAEAMPCRGHPPEDPERPGWANGAFIYLLEEDAEEIMEAIKEWAEKDDNELMSKHILVSDSLMQPLKEALDAKPEGPDGRISRSDVPGRSPRRRRSS